MGSFPLLTTDELEAARERWTRAVPGAAPTLLRENVELVLREQRFRDPLELGLASNLFQVQTILFEASLAFACSGEERYVEPVVRCLDAIADERKRRARLPNEVHRAFVLVGLAVAHALCADALDSELLEATVATLAAELHAASAHEEWGDRVLKRNAWNHTAVAYAAIGCGGLLCRARDARAEGWLGDALERLQLFFADGVTDAGMTREGLTYCGFVFRNAAPLLLAARNAGVWDYRSPAQNPHVERLRRVPRWYAIETFPGGAWLQPINDSQASPKRALGGFLPTFGALDPALCVWVYDALLGAHGDRSHGRDAGMASSSLFESVLWGPDAASHHSGASSGAPTAAAAPGLPDVLADTVVGYLAERVRDTPSSGFSLNCGEFIGGIHDQSDNGSVTLFSDAVPLLIDSGVANDPVEGSASSSHGHNVVLIDGRGQLPSGGGTGCSGSIVRAERWPAATVVTADLAPSYAARGHNPVAHAVRHCVYGKRPFAYLLVLDDFARAGVEAAVFEQLFHTPTPRTWRRMDSELRMEIEFEGAVSGLLLRALDAGAALQDGELFTQHDRTLFGEHHVWRIRRCARAAAMATLIVPFTGERPLDVSGVCDAEAGRIALHWRIGDAHGLDELTFAPGQARAACFTRDGAPLTGGELLLAAEPPPRERTRVVAGVASAAAAAVGRLRAAASAEASDERALARRRRLRRLVDGIEALEADAGASDGSELRLGRELLEQLVAFADLDPDASVLELDYSSGHAAMPLLHYVRYGSYLGLDAHEQAVAHGRRELSPRNPRFAFERYDATATHAADAATRAPLPCKDESFDCAIATSLLAQAQGQPLDDALCELARVLRPGGIVFLAGSRADAAAPALEQLTRGSRPPGTPGRATLAVDRVAHDALSGGVTRPPRDVVVLRRGA